MSITLREITMDNFEECITLKVTEEQSKFVASNMYSLAEAKADGVSVPLAIYNDDTMVGFVMYWYDGDSHKGYIDRLMVDKRYQKRCYGRETMLKIIDTIRSIEGCREIQTSYGAKNTVVGDFYRSLGFKDNGEFIRDEVVLILKVN